MHVVVYSNGRYIVNTYFNVPDCVYRRHSPHAFSINTPLVNEIPYHGFQIRLWIPLLNEAWSFPLQSELFRHAQSGYYFHLKNHTFPVLNWQLSPPPTPRKPFQSIYFLYNKFLLCIPPLVTFLCVLFWIAPLLPKAAHVKFRSVTLPRTWYETRMMQMASLQCILSIWHSLISVFVCSQKVITSQ